MPFYRKMYGNYFLSAMLQAEVLAETSLLLPPCCRSYRILFMPAYEEVAINRDCEPSEI